uniref:Uncharacterized protein n=1 Tax=Trichinella nativa TaxID=6335 RepID=A0A0V1KHM7_9BILA
MWMLPPPPYLTSKLPGASSLLRLVYAVCLVVQCLKDLGGPD